MACNEINGVLKPISNIEKSFPLLSLAIFPSTVHHILHQGRALWGEKIMLFYGSHCVCECLCVHLCAGFFLQCLKLVQFLHYVMDYTTLQFCTTMCGEVSKTNWCTLWRGSVCGK